MTNHTAAQPEELRSIWLREESHAFTGWDFSHLDGRWQSEELPWDYPAIVRGLMQPTDRMLDMDTGGGEMLLKLGHDPALTSVTEGYAPNLELCRQRLEPLGVTVRRWVEGEPLPYADESFDIVLNRHGSFDSAEVRRVLRPGGLFITQQVGGRNNEPLRRRITPHAPINVPVHTLESNLALVRAAGLEVLRSDESFTQLRFFDSGALAFYCRIIEWEFPGFSVESAFDRLLGCHEEIARTGCLLSMEHRFMMVCRRI